jgi:hypothetical protein
MSATHPAAVPPITHRLTNRRVDLGVVEPSRAGSEADPKQLDPVSS